jgi:hypothetical protein
MVPLDRSRRSFVRTLVVQDRRQPASGRGEQISARDLDGLVTRLRDNVHGDGKTAPGADDRVFFICWEDRGVECRLLYRDAHAFHATPGAWDLGRGYGKTCDSTADGAVSGR